MVDIVQDGTPVLRDTAKEVPESMFGTKELSVVLRNMSEALASQHDGVAIAAPQICLLYTSPSPRDV